jgi:hypothetical protein
MPKQVSFTKPGYTNQNTLEKQRKMAEYLRAQADQPIQTQQGVPIQWTQGLSKVLKGYSAGKSEGDLRRTEARNAELESQDREAFMAQIQGQKLGWEDRQRMRYEGAMPLDPQREGQFQQGPPRSLMVPRETDVPPYQYQTPRGQERAMEFEISQMPQSEAQQAQALELKNATARGQTKYGNTPIWGKNEQGEWVVLQPSSAGGGLSIAETPTGVVLNRPQYDPLTQQAIYGGRAQGTADVELEMNPLITEVNEQAKVDVFLANAERVGVVDALRARGIEIAKVEAKDFAESANMLVQMETNMPNLINVVDRLRGLSDEATHTMIGKLRDVVTRELNLGVGASGIARAKYMAIVDNEVLPLLRPTFGAAFTVEEGKALRATLGDPNVSPGEKKAILDAFIAAKKGQVMALQAKTESQSPSNELSVDDQNEYDALRQELGYGD